MGKKQDIIQVVGRSIRRPQVTWFRTTYPSLAEKLVEKSSAKTESGYKPKLTGAMIFEYLYGVQSCAQCGSPVGWLSEKGGFSEFCSRKCVNSSPLVVERRTKTSIERFGVEPNLHLDIQKKKRKTFLKNHGVDNPSKSDKVKQKKIATFQKNFGTDHWTQTENARKVLSKNNPMNNPISVKRLQKTNRKKYGTNYGFGSKVVRDKTLKTVRTKYGVDNVFQNDSVKKQIIDTNLQRYGVRHSVVVKTGKTKICYDRFGKRHEVRGYEDRAIAWLSKKSSVTKITSDPRKIPQIDYEHGVYYPDLLVSSKGRPNRIVEVKCGWTIRHQTVDSVAAKSKAATLFAEKSGLEYWMIFFTKSMQPIAVKSPTKKVLKKLSLQ
jgi:hypothetical protein